MLVVVGAPAWRDVEPVGPAGRACDVARAAAAAGARVELLARVGDDPVGDRLLHGLVRAGVGHTAVLRDPVRSTPLLGIAGTHGAPAPQLEAADVALGLRYVTDVGVLVVTDDVEPGVLRAAVDGASFADASLVVLVAAGSDLPAGLPSHATVLEAPPAGTRGGAEADDTADDRFAWADDEAPVADDDGRFAAMVGRFAAALDAGQDQDAAFRAAVGHAGWEPAPGEL